MAIEPSQMNDATAAQFKSRLGIKTNTFKTACLLGDSVTGQHQSYGVTPTTGSQGFWNWANWAIGSPFHFTQNLGVSGDASVNIFSRISQIHPEIDTVFICACINDIFTFSSTSTQLQVNAEIDRLIGVNGMLTLGLSALKANGKNVCIGTIPPNSAYSTSTDARILVLDAVNTWILASKAAGRCTEVLDIFAAVWDSTQPTLRLWKTNYSYDGTHFSNRGGQAAGLAGLAQMKNMYALSSSISQKLYGRQSTIGVIGQMRTITGIASTMTYGSGTLASGWRSVNNGSGTPTLVLDNTIDYTQPTDYVGARTLKGVAEKWQKATITGAVAGSSIRFQLAAPPVPLAGEDFFGSVDVLVESSTGMSSVIMILTSFFTLGTSPVDQPFSGLNYVKTIANTSSNAQTEREYAVSNFRVFLDTEPIRIPENINNTVALSLIYTLDFNFVADGGAVIYFSRPQIWKK